MNPSTPEIDRITTEIMERCFHLEQQNNALGANGDTIGAIQAACRENELLRLHKWILDQCQVGETPDR